MSHQSGTSVCNAKGLANFETGKKFLEENVYERSKECSKHWTMLRIMLELLIIKAKHTLFHDIFKWSTLYLDLMVSKSKFVPANKYWAKKVVNPLMMGVERLRAYPNHYIEFVHVQTIIFCTIIKLSKTWTNICTTSG